MKPEVQVVLADSSDQKAASDFCFVFRCEVNPCRVKRLSTNERLQSNSSSSFKWDKAPSDPRVFANVVIIPPNACVMTLLNGLCQKHDMRVFVFAMLGHQESKMSICPAWGANDVPEVAAWEPKRCCPSVAE
jgi:hypothetical protein